jgi:hypothetical protein
VRFLGIGTTQVSLDFSKLRGFVESTLADVKHYLDLLRPHLDQTVIDQYEGRGNPGSVFWLEEKLVDGLIRGEIAPAPPAGAPAAVGRPLPVAGTLEEVSRMTNEVFTHLIQPKTLSAAGFVDGASTTAANVQAPNTPEEGAEQYGATIAEFVYYNSLNFAFEQARPAAAPADGANSGLNVANVRTGNDNPKLQGLIARGRPPAPGAPAPPATPAQQLDLYVPGVGGRGLRQGNRSMMLVFNQLLARYI